MCASALVQVHIGRVVYGASNERFGGCGSVLNVNAVHQQQASTLSKHTTPAEEGQHDEVHFPCIGGVRAAEAIDALKLFYARGNPNGQSASHSSRYTQLSVCEIDKFINTSLRPYRC